MVKSSPPDWIFQWSLSVSTKAAIAKNWINPKKHVNEVTDSLAGYFLSTGPWKI